MRMIREAKEVQDKLDELASKLEKIEKTAANMHDLTLLCGWIQALIWVCGSEEMKF